MNDNDVQLVSACLAGQDAAFDALYAGQAGRVKAYFLRSGFSPADGDDLTQEVFLRAFKSLASFDAERGSLPTWLASIARNVARRQWHRRDEPDHFDPELAEETLAANGHPAQSCGSAEQLRAVLAFVEALPTELATIIRLRYVEGRTTRGIAAVTNIPESTVRIRLKEALAMMESWLRSKGFAES